MELGKATSRRKLMGEKREEKAQKHWYWSLEIRTRYT